MCCSHTVCVVCCSPALYGVVRSRFIFENGYITFPQLNIENRLGCSSIIRSVFEALVDIDRVLVCEKVSIYTINDFFNNILIMLTRYAAQNQTKIHAQVAVCFGLAPDVA